MLFQIDKNSMMEYDYHGQRRREALDLRLMSLRSRLFLDVVLTIL